MIARAATNDVQREQESALVGMGRVVLLESSAALTTGLRIDTSEKR